MNGAARIRAAAVTLAGCGALLAAGCGSNHASPHATSTAADTVPRSGAPLKVSPASPKTDDPIDFSFTAPVASGPDGKYRISYSVSITGPSEDNCVATHEVTVPAVGRGATGSVTVGPGDLGRPWCAGAYTARAFELQSANCTGSKPCPQFVRVVGIVARASFTVVDG